MPSSVDQHITFHTTGEEASRLYVKKTIVVGNVSKYSTIMFLSLLVVPLGVNDGYPDHSCYPRIAVQELFRLFA